MRISNAYIQISIVIIAVILAIAALQATRPIALPLAFAFFIAILIYPLQLILQRHLPKWLSLAIVLLVLLAVLGVMVGAISLSIEVIEPQLPQYANQLQQSLQTGVDWLKAQGVSISKDFPQSQQAWQEIGQQFVVGVRSLVRALSLFILVISLLVLLLLEVQEYPRKFKRGFPQSVGAKLIDATSRMSGKLRRFIYVMSFTSLLTGVLTCLWCLILGVDLAIVWGLLAFVLNFIPTLGSIIAVIPPTLIALFFGGAAKSIGTLLGLATIQVIMGNFVDPKLQGSSLNLSAFVALLSIIFWGWVWGIPGAFLGVPMTAAIAGICNEFDATRGVTILLGNSSDSHQEDYRQSNT